MGSCKHVLIPDDVVLVEPRTRERAPIDETLAKITMHGFLLNFVLNDPRIGRGVEGLRRTRKLDEAFFVARPSYVVPVDPADYKAVMNILEGIEWKNPIIAAQQLVFLEAWEDAAHQDEAWFKKRQETEALRLVPPQEVG